MNADFGERERSSERSDDALSVPSLWWRTAAGVQDPILTLNGRVKPAVPATPGASVRRRSTAVAALSGPLAPAPAGPARAAPPTAPCTASSASRPPQAWAGRTTGRPRRPTAHRAAARPARRRRRLLRLGSHHHRIRAHAGNPPRLVELLRHRHRIRHRQLQQRRGGLLQRRGRDRRLRRLRRVLAVHVVQRDRRPRQVRRQRVRLAASAEADDPAAGIDHRCTHRIRAGDRHAARRRQRTPPARRPGTSRRARPGSPARPTAPGPPTAPRATAGSAAATP